MLGGVALTTEHAQLTVVHLPRVIYHRHARRPTTPADASRCAEREAAMAWLANSLAGGASVEPIIGFPGLLRACWPLPEVLPKVSIIIPTRDQVKLLRTCVEGVLTGTDYPNMEVIIVDNDSSDPETLDYLSELTARGVVILPHPYPFNYAAVNNRAAHIASGEFICLLNNDIEILDEQWLRNMVRHAVRSKVGVVGAKLIWSNGMVQHGGVVIGLNGLAAHVGNNWQDEDQGYLGLNQLTHQRSAVTAACLLLKTSLYRSEKGMNEYLFPIAFNDVDLCLRIRGRGHRLIWCPSTRLIHAESASRGKAVREQYNFKKKWLSSDSTDPAYHECFSSDYLSGAYSGLSMSRKELTIRKTDYEPPMHLHLSRTNKST
jgi:GT2 family glycosyltransferase